MLPDKIKYMNWYPFFTVRLLHTGGYGIFRKLIISLITVVGVLFPISATRSLEIRSITQFMTITTRISVALPIFSTMWYVWRKNCGCRMYHTIGISCGRQTLSFGPWGWLIILWNKLGIVIFVVVAYMVFHNNTGYPMLFVCNTAVWLNVYSYIGQLSFEKVLLAKHLQVVRDGKIMGQIPRLRVLIDLNSHVNEFYSLIVFGCCLCTAFVFMSGMAYAWVVCRFTKQYQTLQIFAITCLWDGVQMMLMAHACSAVCEELNNIRGELQRQASQEQEESSVSSRKQIQTIIQELIHTQAEFTCYRFFTIDLTSITAAIAFKINMMMIFIQFTKE